jgi:hypothetical protein
MPDPTIFPPANPLAFPMLSACSSCPSPWCTHDRDNDMASSSGRCSAQVSSVASGAQAEAVPAAQGRRLTAAASAAVRLATLAPADYAACGQMDLALKEGATMEVVALSAMPSDEVDACCRVAVLLSVTEGTAEGDGQEREQAPRQVPHLQHFAALLEVSSGAGCACEGKGGSVCGKKATLLVCRALDVATGGVVPGMVRCRRQFSTTKHHATLSEAQDSRTYRVHCCIHTGPPRNDRARHNPHPRAPDQPHTEAHHEPFHAGAAAEHPGRAAHRRRHRDCLARPRRAP